MLSQMAKLHSFSSLSSIPVCVCECAFKATGVTAAGTGMLQIIRKATLRCFGTWSGTLWAPREQHEAVRMCPQDHPWLLGHRHALLSMQKKPGRAEAESSLKNKTKQNRGAWVAQSVEHPTSAWVMISQSRSSSPVSVLTAQSLVPASDSVSPPSLCSSPAHALSQK